MQKRFIYQIEYALLAYPGWVFLLVHGDFNAATTFPAVPVAIAIITPNVIITAPITAPAATPPMPKADSPCV